MLAMNMNGLCIRSHTEPGNEDCKLCVNYLFAVALYCHAMNYGPYRGILEVPTWALLRRVATARLPDLPKGLREIKDAQRKQKQAQRMADAARRKGAAAQLRAKVRQRAASRRQYQPGPAAFCLEDADGHVDRIDLEHFSATAKAAVTHVGRTEHEIEFLLSDRFRLGVEPSPAGLSAKLSTIQTDDVASARLWLIGKNEKELLTAALIEKRRGGQNYGGLYKGEGLPVG